jgi:hypothetical protein
VKKPCDDCPFRTDLPPHGLRPERAADIAAGLMANDDFPCHKTVDYSNDSNGIVSSQSTRCVGAAIFLEQVRPGGMAANLMFRFAIRKGELNPDQLSKTIPVYGSISDFIAGEGDEYALD